MDKKIWKQKQESLEKSLKATKINKKMMEDNIEELEFLIKTYKHKILKLR